MNASACSEIARLELREAIAQTIYSKVKDYFTRNIGGLPPTFFVKTNIDLYTFIAISKETSLEEIRQHLDLGFLLVFGYEFNEDTKGQCLFFKNILIYIVVLSFVFGAMYDLGIQDFYTDFLDNYVALAVINDFYPERIWLDCYKAASGTINPNDLDFKDPLFYLYHSLMYTKDQPNYCYPEEIYSC